MGARPVIICSVARPLTEQFPIQPIIALYHAMPRKMFFRITLRITR